MVVIKTKSSVVETASNSLIQYWRENPVLAASDLLVRDEEPLILAPIQQLILIEWWQGKFSILTASRGAGKSFIAAVYVALQLMLYPGTKIGIFAPAFRQSKFIFKEFTKLYQESPILQSCVDKEPTIQSDQCICTFRPLGRGSLGSELKALPIGTDGGKIRGERFRKLVIDELAQVPEAIFSSAIQPMISTPMSPMKKVKQIAELKEQLGSDYQEGLITSDNGYIGLTSGFYQFNFWWNKILSFWDEIASGSDKYSLRFVPYTELPDGFLDMDAVRDAQINAPRHVFLTEWMAEWIADSEGAFPMSLLESARHGSVIPKHSRDPNFDKGKQFVFGLDAARENDSTTIVVSEIGYPSKIVFIVELEETPWPEQAKHIFNLIERFHPVLINMDEFGGGGTLRDLLADPESVGLSRSAKVISVDSDVRETGKRLLKLCNFNPVFIEEANNNTKTLLEQNAIKLPDPTHPIEGVRKGNVKGQKKEIDLVQEMINQIASVVVTQTAQGKLHYDLPKTASNNPGAPRVKKKDLYTAFILACNGVYDLAWKPKSESGLVIQGVIKEIPTVTAGRVLTPNSVPGIVVGGANLPKSSGGKIIIPGGGIITRRNG